MRKGEMFTPALSQRRLLQGCRTLGGLANIDLSTKACTYIMKTTPLKLPTEIFSYKTTRKRRTALHRPSRQPSCCYCSGAGALGTEGRCAMLFSRGACRGKKGGSGRHLPVRLCGARHLQGAARAAARQARCLAQARAREHRRHRPIHAPQTCFPADQWEVSRRA